MKKPPFQTVPTFVPCYLYVSFLADQGEKLFQVVEPGLHFSLLGLAPHTGHELFTRGNTRQMRHGTHIFASVSKL